MNDSLILILAIVIAAAIGAFLGMFINKLKSQNEKSTLTERNNHLEQQLQEQKQLAEVELNRQSENFNKQIHDLKETIVKIENEREAIRREKELLNSELARRNADFENLQIKNKEQKAEVEQLQEKFTKEFENLANKILDEKSNKFTEQNKENIKNILNPLQEKIKTFEEKVDLTQKESISMHSALKEQLLGLKDLNQQMTKEAINLTKALKGDSKTQGDWGETQLEILLEKSRLKKGIHYTTQGGFRDENGKLKKPDFIIDLPENKHLIIDSKVSLTSYEAYYNSDDDTIKSESLKKHLESIKKHIKDLGGKEYSKLYGINAPDYVLMFVPIENALLIALNEDNKLYIEALDKNVVLVSTSTLLATLSTVASIWKHEDQKNNVLEIANQAGRLYDQFVNLTDDLIKVGNQLNTVKGSYDSSMKKLTGRGNLITKVENIKKLGIASNKSINQSLLNKAQEDE